MRTFVEEDYPHKELTEKIIGAAIEVHRELGPGFVEPVYEAALMIELGQRGLAAAEQRNFAVLYKGIEVGRHRTDVIVEAAVLLELKAVEQLTALHATQVKSTLKAAGLEVGLLINFNVSVLKDGIRRIVLTRDSKSGCERRGAEDAENAEWDD